jgi:voltage-gated potassium channel
MLESKLHTTKLKTWQKKSAWPLVALSLAYTFVYVFPIFAYPLSESTRNFCQIAEYLIWAVFILDYIVQFLLATNKKKFFGEEWVSLIFIFVPFLRPVRAIRGIIFLRQASTHPKDSALLSLPWIIATLGGLMMLIMAAAVLDVERLAPNSTIHSTGDALWWSLVTVTTIGYGDKYPVTSQGKLLAAFLIIFGVGLIASLTGFFASWIIKQTHSQDHTKK